MKIGFIGAGKVCHALSFYLKQHHEIVGIYSKTWEKAHALAEKLSAVAYEQIGEPVSDAELILIATTDDQIAAVADQIVAMDTKLSGKAFAHLSGSLSSEVLRPLYERGAAVFSLHPVQSFSHFGSALRQLPHTVFTAEGLGDYEQFLERLLQDFPNELIRIEPSGKSRYHLAAVMLSNYLVTLYALSEELLEDVGMSGEQARRLLNPLLDSTAQNLREKGFGALTGPLERGDRDTIRRHLETLKDERAMDGMYRLMAEETLRLLEKNGKAVSQEMRQVLTTGVKPPQKKRSVFGKE